ncbi:MAG TPA: hypothetical protein VF584_09005 [Longimicrobium sp.]|jgi:hypothetical protein
MPATEHLRADLRVEVVRHEELLFLRARVAGTPGVLLFPGRALELLADEREPVLAWFGARGGVGDALRAWAGGGRASAGTDDGCAGIQRSIAASRGRCMQKP